MVLAHGIDAVAGESEIGVAQGRIGRYPPRFAVVPDKPDGPVREMRKDDEAAERGVSAAAIFVHPRPHIELRGQDFPDFPVPVAHEHAAAPLARPAFQPVDAFAVRADE